MTELDKLRATLCTVEKVRKDVMELRFGCKVVFTRAGTFFHDMEYNGIYTWKKILKETRYTNVRTDFEELDIYKDKLNIWETWICKTETWYLSRSYEYQVMYTCSNTYEYRGNFNIVWNHLQERHLRMYCEEKGYAFAIGSTGKIIWNRNCKGSYSEIDLDNAKDLEDQDEKTLSAINTFLTEQLWLIHQNGTINEWANDLQ